MQAILAHIGSDHLGLATASALAAGIWLVPKSFSGRDALGRRRLPVLLALLVGGVVFQVVHFAEHLLQMGYWLAHPLEAPWLTPWAVIGRDLLAGAVDGQAATGNELLHLVGNAVFFAGVVAGLLAVRERGAEAGSLVWLRRTVWLQGAHLAEHVVLTVSLLLLGQANGLSTLFGVLEPGTALAGGVRVWFHFLLNLVVTVFAIRGLGEVRDLLGSADHSRRASPEETTPEPVAASSV